MTRFQGFKTKQEAEQFSRSHGGILCFEERTPKRGKLTNRGREYMDAVIFGGLDKDTYPYCVCWNEHGY